MDEIEIDSTVDPEEVKKCLQDAQLYEEDMSEDMMISYYKAIKASQSTANEENHSRNKTQNDEELMEVLEKSIIQNDLESQNEASPMETSVFTPKKWLSEKKTSKCNNNNEDDLENFPSTSSSGNGNTFNDMPSCSRKAPLKIITHDLKHKQPLIQTSAFLDQPAAKRFNLLLVYHAKMSQIWANLVRNSLIQAPLPKQITATTEFSSTFNDKSEESYVSRAGRQIKRKNYCYGDDENSSDAFINKKAKSNDEEEWLEKNSGTKTRKSEVSSSVNSTTSSSKLEGATKTTLPKAVKSKAETGRTPLSKKIKNSEIMKRSNLFADTPKRRSKQERLFDDLKEGDKNNLKEFEDFEATLKDIKRKKDDDDDDIISAVTVQEPFARRVIVPPILGRKPIHGAKKNIQADSNFQPLPVTIASQKVVAPANTSKANVNNSKESTVGKKRFNRSKASPSQKPSTSQEEKVDCPICSKAFLKREVEDHAARCGENTEVITRSSSHKMSKITCDVCDKVVDFDENYEVHVTECLKKFKS